MFFASHFPGSALASEMESMLVFNTFRGPADSLTDQNDRGADDYQCDQENNHACFWSRICSVLDPRPYRARRTLVPDN